jgi:threonine/homoserine/homoserine lactone efflux protein
VTSWQDVLLALCAVAFLGSLVPSMLDKGTRISRRTSVPTALGAWAQGVTLVSLGLVVSGALTLLIAAAWTQLAIARPLAAPAPKP